MVERLHLRRHPRVVASQQPDVADALAQHQRPVEAEPERQARPALRVEPAGAQHVAAGKAALEQLDPLLADQHLDLEAVVGVGMLGRDRAMAAAGQHRRDDQLDHLLEVAAVEPRSAADPPQVELVGLADVQPVDHVAAVDQARAGHHHVVVTAGQPPQGGRHHGRGVRAQQVRVVQVARVAGIAGGGVRRVAEQLVVLGDGHHRAGPVDEDRAAPARGQRLGDGGGHQLHGVGAGGRVGQVAQRQRGVELLGCDGAGHGWFLSLRWTAAGAPAGPA